MAICLRYFRPLFRVQSGHEWGFATIYRESKGFLPCVSEGGPPDERCEKHFKSLSGAKAWVKRYLKDASFGERQNRPWHCSPGYRR